MLSQVAIINNGLGKYSAQRVKRLDPANSPLEVACAQGYPQWRASELAKRRWVFATIFGYVMTASAYDAEAQDGYAYTFPLPTDCMRPFRDKRSTWKQSKRNLLSQDSTLTIDYVRNVTEDEFDTLFNDVLSCRCAMETVTFVTESRVKKADLALEYDQSVGIAAKANAFVIGPEDVNGDDSKYPFLAGRWQ